MEMANYTRDDRKTDGGDTMQRKAEEQHAKFLAQVKQLERQRVPFVSQMRKLNAHPSLKLDSLNADVKDIVERIGRNDGALLLVRLTDAGVNDLSAVKLAQALTTNSKLSQLVLSRNAIGDQGCAAITEALISHPSLLQLSLAANHILNQGAESCAALLRQSTVLMELNLSAKPTKAGNQTKFEQLLQFQVTAPGALALAQGLRCNSTLTALSLANQPIWDAGAIAIFQALDQNTVLQNLDLSCASITCASGSSISKCLNNAHTALTRLTLAKNKIADEGARAIAASLGSNRALKYLDLSDNRITSVGVAAFCNVFQCGENCTLQYIATTSRLCSDTSAEEMCKRRAGSATKMAMIASQPRPKGLKPVRAFLTPYSDSKAHLLYLKVPIKSKAGVTKYRPMVAVENTKLRNRSHAHLRRYDPTYRQLKQTQIASQKYSEPANLPLEELWDHQARKNALSYAQQALRQIEQRSSQKRPTKKILSVLRRYSFPITKVVERRSLWQSQATTLQSLYAVHEW